MPLAAAGYRVSMIERLKQEGLHDRVHVVEEDFLASEPDAAPCDAVWTSCSWHCSANHHRPLGEFIDSMQRMVRPGGLFGAEFMMPLTQRHHVLEHYTSPEKLRRYFIGDWDVLLTLRTNEFTEQAHVGQLQDHNHRMGLLLAARASTPS